MSHPDNPTGRPKPEYPTAMEPPAWAVQPTQPAEPTQWAEPAQPASVHYRYDPPAVSRGSAAVPAAQIPPVGPATPPEGQWLSQPPQPSPPAVRSRTPLVVASIVAALLLVGGAAMGYLWWDTDTQLRETRAQLTGEVEQLRGTVAEQEQTIGGLSRELQVAEDELAAAEQDLAGTQNMVDRLRDDQGVIRTCFALIAELDAAVEAGDQAAFDAVIDEANQVCEEADKIIAGG